MSKWWDTMWNPYIGCTKCSPACYNCWARREEQGRFRHLNRLIPERWKLGQSLLLQRAREGVCFDAGPVYQGDDVVKRPLGWRKPRTVFVCGRGDLFHSRIPFEEIDRVWAVMAASPKHTFIVCTKRSERMAEYLGCGAVRAPLQSQAPVPNVILMVTAEDQQRADERIPQLLACPAACRAVSIEPMLGPISLQLIPDGGPCLVCGDTGHQLPDCQQTVDGGPDWVILGGESGKDARPLHPAWVRSLCDQCVAAGVPFFFKQWGEYAPGELVSQRTRMHFHSRYGQGATQCKPELIRYAKLDGTFAAAGEGCSRPGYVTMYRIRRKRAGRELDGRIWDERPGRVGTITGRSAV